MGFENYRSYEDFVQEITKISRFARGEKALTFIKEFRRQIHERATRMQVGYPLFRAVRGHHEFVDDEGVVHLSGSLEARLIPDARLVGDGRANPRGIAYLYLATTEETAVSEIRPWVGEAVSIARFQTCREIKIADFSRNHGKVSFAMFTFEELQGEQPMSQEKVDEAVWISVDNAFSKPVSRQDSNVSYVPTQLLTEIVKEEGFDGLAYKSSFGGKSGYNVVLFDLGNARVRECSPFVVKGIKVDFDEIGSAWSRN